MLLIFIGPACSGKSTVAGMISKETGAGVWSGKDYLRLAKNGDLARKEFAKMARTAAFKESLDRDSLIYLVTETSALEPSLTELPNTLIVAFTAEIGALRERFTKRTGQPVTGPISLMLERQRAKVAEAKADLAFDTTEEPSGKISEEIMKSLKW